MHGRAVWALEFEEAGGDVHEGAEELGQEDQEGAVVLGVEAAEAGGGWGWWGAG